MRLDLNEPNIELLRARWLELAWRSLDCVTLRDGSVASLDHSLRELVLHSDAVSDLEELKHLESLDYLYLAGCGPKQLDQLPPLPSLTHLIVRGATFENFEHQDRFPKLEVLSLWDAPR